MSFKNPNPLPLPEDRVPQTFEEKVADIEKQIEHMIEKYPDDRAFWERFGDQVDKFVEERKNHEADIVKKMVDLGIITVKR